MHDITVVHNIFLTFYAHFSGLLHCVFGAQSHEIVIFYYFGANETLFKIGVNNSCGLRCFSASQECPCPDFVGAGREVGL